ncbi:MAG: tetratricopeptide repeat protein [Proteobacteria bacterium]|nr:MAG: tetratricopeptide repeat protein [Pseudomonadota bacterium]
MIRHCFVCCSLFFFSWTLAHATEDRCQKSIESGDYAKAEEVCQQSLHSVEPDSSSELAILLNLTSIYLHIQNPENQTHYINKVKNHPKFINSIPTQYNWHRIVGQKYYLEADYATSKIHLLKAYNIAKQQANQEWLSKSHNDMGLVELKLGDYKSALTHYQQSLELKQQFGTDYQIAKTLNNLGMINLYLEQADQAVNYYESALTHYLKYSQSQNFDHRVFLDIAHIYQDLTKAYVAANNTEKADYYAQAIINSLDTNSNSTQQLRTLINLSQWHLDNGNLDVLHQLLIASKTLMDKSQLNPELLAQWYLLKAKMHQKNQQTSAAIAAVEDGILISADLPETSLKADLLYLKAALLEDINPRQALQAFKEYQQLRSQFLQQKYDSDLKTIQHQIETQKIQQQLLNQELTNSRQQQKLHQLTSLVLIVSLVLISMTALLVFYQFKRKKEKQALMQSIRYHKQQLLIFQTSHKANLEASSESHKEALKKALVELLIDATTIWEKTTQTSLIELAEQSKIWTVSIDNGTLRTRSLEKYLSLEKIPHNPRWRNVVQTGHFILSQDNLQTKDRHILEAHLENVMEEVRALSLNG